MRLTMNKTCLILDISNIDKKYYNSTEFSEQLSKLTELQIDVAVSCDSKTYPDVVSSLASNGLPDIPVFVTPMVSDTDRIAYFVKKMGAAASRKQYSKIYITDAKMLFDDTIMEMMDLTLIEKLNSYTEQSCQFFEFDTEYFYGGNRLDVSDQSKKPKKYTTKVKDKQNLKSFFLKVKTSK